MDNSIIIQFSYCTINRNSKVYRGVYLMKHIFIHGLGQKALSWNETISYMIEQDNIICPELYSLLNEKDVTYSNIYNAFSEYCNNISEPISLCGLSLGGVIALNYAIDNPTKVKSLVLIATQYEMPKILLKLQNIIFKFIPEKYFKNMGMRKLDFIELTKSMMCLNFNEDLKKLSCPVTIICGEKDTANKKASKSLAKNIEHSEIYFIENAKHEVNMDSPRELAGILNKKIMI